MIVVSNHVHFCLGFLSLAVEASSSWFKQTNNISEAEFGNKIVETLPAFSLVDCGRKCVKENCNSYYFNKETRTCELALLEFLENPIPSMIGKSIFIRNEAVEELPLYCKGKSTYSVKTVKISLFFLDLIWPTGVIDFMRWLKT